jgi:hypothetical protein
MDRIVRSLIVLVAAGLGLARADVKVQEKSHLKLEGGLGTVQRMMGKEDASPSTVAVRGDRKLTLGASSGELIDLKEEKVYRLDPRKRTYQVTTFDELRKQNQPKEHRVEERHERKEPAKEPDTEIDLDVKETGQKKTINGFDTHQVITTVVIRKKGQTLEQGGGTVFTTDTWLTPQAKARDEVAAFDLRYLKKLYGEAAAKEMAGAFAAIAAAGLPGMGLGMEKLREAGTKLEGYPILTTTLIEKVRSAAELAPKAEEQEEAPADVKGIGGFLAKRLGKKMLEKKPQPRELLMTGTQEVLSLSTSVTDADVAMPGGYREEG